MAEQQRPGHFVRYYLLLAVLLSGLSIGCDSSPSVPPAPAAAGTAWQAPADAKTVKIVVDYGDDSEKHLTRIPYTEGMTALDALKLAEGRPRGVQLKMEGSGEMTMVLAIDDLANEVGIGDGRNWIYRVNGEQPHKSCGVYTLAPDDVILWKFEKFEH